MLCYVATIGHDPKTLLGDCFIASLDLLNDARAKNADCVVNLKQFRNRIDPSNDYGQ